MADVDMGVTETSATGLAVISALVQKQLIAQAKIMFTVQDETARVAPGAKSVAFPRAGDLSPVAKAENTASESVAVTYAVDTLSLDKHYHTFVRLEDIAGAQSVLSVETDILERAGRGMAKQMDANIYAALKAGASASSPDHIVQLSSTGTILDEAAILTARKLLDDQDVPDDERFMLVNPAQEKQLLAIANFIQSERYGSSAPIQNGEIGRCFGFKVIKTTVCEALNVLFYHRSCAAFARQIEPKWEQMRNLSKLANEYSLSALYGVKVLDSGKRQVLMNASGS